MLSINAQVLINEVVSSNNRFLKDDEGDYPDWIELYNPTSSSVNLKDWSMSDSKKSQRWIFPNVEIAPNNYFVLFSSGKNKSPMTNDLLVDHWETVVQEDDLWNYFIGDKEPPSGWQNSSFDASAFPKAMGGFGYGDSDDNTILNDPTSSVYYRTDFVVHELVQISKIVLSMDYDDSFIAFINGVEVARNNIDGRTVTFDALANTDHEALLYTGQRPEYFELNMSNLKSILVEGINVLAIQINNVSASSTDLSGRTWLHFGLNTKEKVYRSNPAWFDILPDTKSNITLHTDFKLSRNEVLSLYNNSSILVDTVRINAEFNNSNARIPDGAQWCYLESPSPSKTNGSKCLEAYSSIPVVSHKSGYYPSSIQVNVSGIECRYTVDGSDPSSVSPIFPTTLAISKTTSLKVRSFETGKLPSKVSTALFVINETSKLPVVSITSAPGNLFNDGTNGPAVYDKAKGFTQSQKTGCHIQYFSRDKSLWFEENASFTPVGNYSLDFGQKSIQFVFDEDWGAANEEIPNIFFNDKPNLKSLHGFRVRNLDDDAASTRMRDVVANRMGINTACGSAAYQNVAVYINGRYWGHYAARELLDNYFMRDNYNANPDSVNMVKTAYSIKPDYYPEEGSEKSFIELSNYIIQTNLTNEVNYNLVLDKIDLDNWVDYYANEIYNNNTDWYPSEYFNNIRLAECTDPKVKWKFILWDMGVSQGNYVGVNYNLLRASLESPQTPNRYTDMMNSLLKNSKFKNYFINRFADLMNENWVTSKIHKMIDDNASEMASEISKDNKRWGSVDSISWRNNIQVLKQFHTQRPSIQRNHIQTYFKLAKQVEITLDVLPKGAGVVKISSITPENLPWKGIYFNGNPVTLIAIANPGFTFTHWTSNGEVFDSNLVAINVDVTKNNLFKANFEGRPQALELEFSEVNYNSDSTISSGDWVELHNRTSSNIDLSNYTYHDSQIANAYKIPSGTMIKAKDYLVFSSDVDKFKLRNPLVKNFIGPTGFDLSNKGESINLLDRTSKSVLSMSYADSLDWPCAADGLGRTLELKSEGSDPNKADSWFDGCIGGSPGTAYRPCQSSILITEINYKSLLSKDAGDWIELYNNTNAELNLSNWKVSDGGSNFYIIPLNTKLQADQYLVIAQDLIKFKALFPNVKNVIGPMLFGFNGNGDVIKLSNNIGGTIYSVCFDDTDPFPKGPDGGGFTLELKEYTANVNDGKNYFAGCPSGSPGTKYDPNCGMTSVANHFKSSIQVYPNPAQDLVFISVDNNLKYNILIRDLDGKILENSSDLVGLSKIDIAHLISGLFVIEIVQREKLVYRSKIFKI